MIPQQPQQEYIITEEELTIFLDWLSYRRYNDCDVDSFISRIRSRPHTSSTEALEFKKINYNAGKCCCEDYYNCHDCRDDRQFNKEHDATLRNAERNATLERAFTLINDGKSALYERCPDGHWDQILQAKMDVLCWIEESLLTPPPPSDPHIEEFPESP